MAHANQSRISLLGLPSLIVALSLTSCATGTSSSGQPAASDGDERASDRSSPVFNDCILGGSVRDFTALDNRNLILYGPGNRPYHVILVTPSIDLESEFRIGVFDRDAAFGGISRICPYGGDAIIVDGPIRERIPIRSIEEIDDTRAEALKVRFGVIEAADEDAVTVTELE